MSMNVNGRLTAPPQDEVALVTNSVDGIVWEGRDEWPETRGTTLVHSLFSNGLGTRTLRAVLRAGRRRAGFGAGGPGKYDPVSVTHGLSASWGAAGS